MSPFEAVGRVFARPDILLNELPTAGLLLSELERTVIATSKMWRKTFRQAVEHPGVKQISVGAQTTSSSRRTPHARDKSQG